MWNFESGYFKASLKEQFLDLRSKEEKPIEKIIFIYNPEKVHLNKVPLFSAHADGCVRVWDVNDTKMINEYNCQASDDEGLTTMAHDELCQILLVGSSKGDIRILDLKLLLQDLHDVEKQGTVVTKKCWRAHMLPISSLSYVKLHNIILSASKDCCVRLWTLDGEHIGTFGDFGDHSWALNNRSTFCPLPPDLQHYHEAERKRQAEIKKMEYDIKMKIIETWKSSLISNDRRSSNGQCRRWASGSPKNFKETSDQVDSGIINITQIQVAKKWLQIYSLQKNIDDWTLTPDLITMKNSKHFFSFDASHSHKSQQNIVNVKFDSVYHSLQVHAMEDVNETLANHSLKHPKPKIKGL